LKQAVNRNLQDELRYERELNEKMRDEISRFEAEKESIIGRLRDAEALTNEIQRETTQIKQNLQRKTEELKRLEREHESNMDRLRELTTQLESLRGQEMHGKGEKRRLEEELAELTREKEGLIRRMNDLNARYDDYVQTMERERLEIVRANRNHVKLLTAKLVYQMLNEMVKKRRKDGLQAMQSCSSQLKRVESIV
jgi:chromosome segregation ATPase